MNKSIRFLLVGFIFGVAGNLFSQGCQNNIKFPASTITAPSNFDTVLISSQSFPGDYVLANEFMVGETYVFTTDVAGDMITLRSSDQSTVLAFGTQPLSYTISADTVMNIHFNLPGCGTEVVGRSTHIIHQFIIDESNVGVNVAVPEATLDVNGKIKVADDLNTAVEGMIRYNVDLQDFEGYDGQKWRSFTKSSAIWGEVLAPIATTSNYFEADDGGAFDYLGQTLDIDGNYAVVSAYAQDAEGDAQRGSAYILKKEGSSFVFYQKIVSPDGEAFDQFGEGGVDISGNFLIVGSQNDNYQGSVGTAEIFDLKNGLWSYVTTLSNNSGNNDYHFGRAVAIDGQYAAVRNADFVNGIDQVLVFKKSGNLWNLVETIIGPSNSGTFGASLEFYEGDLYIGDPEFFSANVIGGRVSIYAIDENDNVSIMDSIENAGVNTHFGDLFGREIDLDDDKMIISGVGYEVGNVSRSGQAYIFSKQNGNWVLEKVLQENPTTDGSDFGNSVSIYQNQVLVSTSSFNGAPKSYIYKYEDDWELEAVLMSGEQSESDFFGFGAEISDNLIMIGASRTDVGNNQAQGIVYIFCK
ncbi:MAG: hypothetical protein ACJA1A_001485 [Saprospiraceae bacterium]|jgi:hypothetical protein